MAMNSMGMGFVFTAANLGKPTFKGVQKDLTQTAATSEAASARIKTAMSSIKAGAVMAVGGAVGLGVAFGLAGVAGEFERGIAGVGAITRATASDLKLLEEAAIQAGIKTQFSPTEAVEGLTNLGQAGLNAADSMLALQPTLDLAAGSLGQLGVADAAGLSVQAMKAFGIQAKDVGFALDRMLRTTNSFNISARELPLAFGIGARGALALNASLDDVAISLGLAKNIMPSVERASTSIAVGMERLAREQGQAKLATLFHVQAVDKATGKFRPFLDIINDMIGSSKKMTEAQRSNALAQVFGARAGGGISAILKQLTDGVKTSTGEVLKGTKAIEYYRNEMQQAGGAAGEFSGALLDTFAGQKILLQGTIQTLAIVLGKPFARVLKPFVKLVTDTLNALIKLVQQIPDPLLDVVSGAFALASAIALGAGAVLLFKGVMGVLGVTLAGFTSLISGALLSLWPFALAIGAGILAMKIFAVVWEENWGGIRDVLLDVWGKVKLFWAAMVQLFTQGGFSGAVRRELNEGSAWFKEFIIDTALMINRIGVFFGAFADAASAGIDHLRPAFEELVNLFNVIGESFGWTAMGANQNATAYDNAAAAGMALGDAVGWLAEFFGTTLTLAFKGIGMTIRVLRGELIDWGEVWLELKVMIFKVIDSIVRGVFFMAKGITRAIESISPDLAAKLGFSPGAAVAEAERDLLRSVAENMGVSGRVDLSGGGDATPERTRALTARIGRATGFSPSAFESKMIASRLEAAQQAGFSEEQMEKLVRTIIAEQRPVVVEMDGERVGEITSRAQRRTAARSFSEVPTGG